MVVREKISRLLGSRYIILWYSATVDLHNNTHIKILVHVPPVGGWGDNYKDGRQ